MLVLVVWFGLNVVNGEMYYVFGNMVVIDLMVNVLVLFCVFMLFVMFVYMCCYFVDCDMYVGEFYMFVLFILGG